MATGATSNYHGVGRRKSAVARVWLKRGKGGLDINGREVKNYFDTDITRTAVARALDVTGTGKNFDIYANVQGGGQVAQAHAIKLGIARALLIFDGDLRPVLKQNNLLTVDARVKERKKYGQRGARRKFQFVKR